MPFTPGHMAEITSRAITNRFADIEREPLLRSPSKVGMRILAMVEAGQGIWFPTDRQQRGEWIDEVIRMTSAGWMRSEIEAKGTRYHMTPAGQAVLNLAKLRG